MNISEIKQKLQGKQHTIGTWMQIPNTSVAEIMGKAGYDWVAVDLEHGHFSNENLPDIFRAIELGGTVPFARLAQCEQKDIKQALDAGARGLILPMIETSEQLKQGVSWAYYPPIGIRGVGYSRANLFGKKFDTCVQQKTQELVIAAQIEHVRAVENLESILSVNGLDAIIVGPYDLSGSMGLTGKFDDPRFVQMMSTISEKAEKDNIPMGVHVVQPDTKKLKEAISNGYQFIAYGIDAVFLYRSAERPINESNIAKIKESKIRKT